MLHLLRFSTAGSLRCGCLSQLSGWLPGPKRNPPQHQPARPAARRMQGTFSSIGIPFPLVQEPNTTLTKPALTAYSQILNLFSGAGASGLYPLLDGLIETGTGEFSGDANRIFNRVAI